MIEEKISMISAEKIALEDLLKRANAEFQNDKKVIELYEKYRRLFKESVVLEDFQVHRDDFDNNDNDGGSNLSNAPASSNSLADRTNHPIHHGLWMHKANDRKPQAAV
ncbi:hypothetical protein Tco_0503386 [Tanacetum coccineum]